MVQLESLWAFPESYTADDSRNECSSNSRLAWKVHLDNAYGFAAVLIQEM